MTKIEFEELYWRIIGLFNEHAGCVERECHCSASPIEFADDLQKLMFESLKLEDE